MLDGEGRRYTREEVAERAGLELDVLLEARAPSACPPRVRESASSTDDDLALAQQASLLLGAGLGTEDFLQITRAMSQAMSGVAASLVSTFGEALLQPGDTERDLGLRYAESMRELGPLAGPALAHMLNLRMREQARQAVVGQAELQSGRLPGAQAAAVGFVDIVGFTNLGEQVPPEELGAVAGRFERRVEDAVEPPVRLVKTIGDAAMLVAPDPRSADPDRCSTWSRARLRPTTASSCAAAWPQATRCRRAGDWYGRPVNLASRLTAFARRGSVVTTAEVREAAGGDYAWSFAGRRRFKGVSGEVGVFRVRRGADVSASRTPAGAARARRARRPARSVSALSVFSQVKSSSSRPKWP